MGNISVGPTSVRLCLAFGLLAATVGSALGGCSSESGLDGGPGKAEVGTGGGASGSGDSTSVAVSTGGVTSVAGSTGGSTAAAGSSGATTGPRGGDSGATGGKGGVGSIGPGGGVVVLPSAGGAGTGGKGGAGFGGTGGGGAAGSSAGGASTGGSVTGSSLAVDAGAGSVDAGSKPKDFTRLIGKYKVAALGGGLMCGSTGSSIQFKDEDMTVARGSDANLVATTNPMPGEYPAACALKINAVDSPESGMLMAVQNSSCSSGGVTLTLSAYVFANGESDPKVVISANGMLTGGPHGDCNFSYSAEALPAP